MAHPTVAVYYRVIVTLMALLAVTIAVAEFDLGPWNFPATVVIASIKSSLILLFFMHVRYSSSLIWLVVGSSFFWLVILFGLTLSDYLTRGAM